MECCELVFGCQKLLCPRMCEKILTCQVANKNGYCNFLLVSVHSDFFQLIFLTCLQLMFMDIKHTTNIHLYTIFNNKKNDILTYIYLVCTKETAFIAAYL